MAQPATAAIVVAMIFVAAFVLFFGYKGYKKYHYHKQRKAMQAELPPIREPPSNYFLAAGATPSGGSPLSPPSTIGTLYGDTWGRNSWRGSTSKASLGGRGYSDMGGRRMSSSGLLGSPGAEAAFGGSQTGAAADGSAPASPLSLGVDAVLPAAPGEAYDHSRGISSTSTNALKRSYAGSVYSGAGGGPGSDRGATDMYLPPRRQSYLPHLPSNRESIQIVPPQPLGFGLGGMAQATDEKTLAFSTVSGIGSDGDEFGKGLVWAEGETSGNGGDGNDLATASGSGAKVAHGDRARYLAEGPVRTWSGSGGGAAGPSNWQSPSAPPSRSLTPGAAPSWEDRSSGHRGPGNMSASTSSSSRRASSSQSQRRLPQQAHPLSESSYSSQHASPADPLSTPTNHQNGTFASLQSPLQLMSDGPNGAHGRHASDADTLNTGPSSVEGVGANGSPIIGAFRSAGTGNYIARANENMPELASGSASGSGSHSSPTDPSTDSSGRPSAADEESIDRGERFAVGKDGVLRLGGPAVPEKQHESEARSSGSRKSWGFTNILGRA
ncbi:hypothetical protein CBOM_00433 [Ceraceosorus bombacis]|uniref:Uncharacterized protein n=1 Tax=Ceraceosorus bombacis TaxID=401625 RepID=A0A0P1BAT9_9BASI|nr:hypothetical protein CBOM_00433 [Ceraceosorus bombacis]